MITGMIIHSSLSGIPKLFKSLSKLVIESSSGYISGRKKKKKGEALAALPSQFPLLPLNYPLATKEGLTRREERGACIPAAKWGLCSKKGVVVVGGTARVIIGKIYFCGARDRDRALVVVVMSCAVRFSSFWRNEGGKMERGGRAGYMSSILGN